MEQTKVCQSSAIFALLFIGGCAHPLVVYDQVKGPNTSGARVFQFTETMLNFSYPTSAAAMGAPDLASLTIKPAAIPDNTKTFTISGTDWSDNWGVSTDLATTMVGDTTLIKQIGSKITDQRIAAITTAGSIATSLIGLTAAKTVDVSPPATAVGTAPTGLSLEDFLKKTLSVGAARTDPATGKPQCSTSVRDAQISCTNLELDGGSYDPKDGKTAAAPYLMDIDIAARPLDAFQVNSFPYKSNSLLYSACRPVNVTVKNKALGTKWSVSANFVMADPTWYEAIAFPGSGTVSTGDGCGASSSADAYTASTPLDFLKAATDAATTAKAQLDKDNSSGAK